MKSQPRQFESLKIWESFRNSLPWYFAVSINQMPAKYLIAKHIPCDLDISAATEGELWSENSLLTDPFLEIWEKVRMGKMTSLPPKLEGPSLLDLNVELSNRMLTHCNFCRWDCKVDRSKGTRHGTCQLESTSNIGSYFHHWGEEIIFRGTGGSGTIFFTSCNMRCSFCHMTQKIVVISVMPAVLVYIMTYLLNYVIKLSLARHLTNHKLNIQGLMT